MPTTHCTSTTHCTTTHDGNQPSRESGRAFAIITGRMRLAPDLVETDLEDSSRSAIRVVLADDHELMRSSLRLLLDGEGGLEVIAEANDLASVLGAVRAHKPDVLVLDLRLPGDAHNDTIATLREQAPDTQIVVATMHDSPVYAQHALACGALGLVHKELADRELPDAIRAAAQGLKYVSPRVADRVELDAAC
jgi:two-component system response regulator NreC